MKRILIMCAALAACTLAAEAREIISIGKEAVVAQGQTVSKVVSIGKDVIVNGTVEGNAVSIGGSVRVASTGVIKGDVIAIRGDVVMADGCQVFGSIKEIRPGELGNFFRNQAAEHCATTPGRCHGTASTIGFIALALLLVLLFPATSRISAAINAHPVASFLWGALGLMAIAPIAFMLLISIIGILMIPVEIIIAILLLVGGYIFCARAIGTRLLAAFSPATRHAVIETLTGLITLWLIGFVPVIGFLVKVIATTTGFGAIIRSFLPINND